MSAQDSKVKLIPVLPEDYPTLARLQSVVFADNDFSVVAFGPLRNSDLAVDGLAASLAAAPKPGETKRDVKAVRTGPTGEEEILGYAGWTICVGREGSEEEKKRLGTKESWAQKEEPVDKPFGPSANVKFCMDVFLPADEHMARSTGGRDYAKLRMLAVSPKCQRMGIGSMMLEEGLREADAQGLQSILGASPQGINLYRRHGYVDFAAMELKLWEYEGGEGMGATQHVVMHRPAATRRGSSGDQ